MYTVMCWRCRLPHAVPWDRRERYRRSERMEQQGKQPGTVPPGVRNLPYKLQRKYCMLYVYSTQVVQLYRKSCLCGIAYRR